MSEVASRELRNNTRQLLDRVEQGEDLTITVDGRPVAVLRPVSARRQWVGRRDITQRLLGRQADPALAQELRVLFEESTDDLPW